jgi:hypothetical protein
MMQYALPIVPIPEVEINVSLSELDRCAAKIDRDDYRFGGSLGHYVYVWFDGKDPIYVGVGGPSGQKRYLKHWTSAMIPGSEGMNFSRYLAAHKTTIWPAFAASNLNEAVAHSLERLLIATYRRRQDRGTLFNVRRGKLAGRKTRGDDAFDVKRPAERAPVKERDLVKFQTINRPFACWQTAKEAGVVIPDDFGIRVLVDHNPKAGGGNERQFALYAEISTVGAYRSAYRNARLNVGPERKWDDDIDGHLFWDSCCQHPKGRHIELVPSPGGQFSRKCLFERSCR